MKGFSLLFKIMRVVLHQPPPQCIKFANEHTSKSWQTNLLVQDQLSNLLNTFCNICNAYRPYYLFFPVP